MKKSIFIICVLASGCTAMAEQVEKPGPAIETQTLVPLTERVNVQADSACVNQIIDGCWVAVGAKKAHAIQRDFNLMFNGKPSYRFELKEDDNTLSGYAAGETKGRAEFSYCYATSDDFKGKPADTYKKAQIMKTVYHHGKGICPQGASRDYEFSVYIPSTLGSDVSTIFAQWHGMPDRTLVQTPQGEVKTLTVDEFIELEKTTLQFCTPEMLDRYRKEIPLMADYQPEEGTVPTNSQVYRVYIERYLCSLPVVNQDLDLIISQKEATMYGVPIQVYFFSRNKIWKEYERIQSDIFDHLLAMVPKFDLKVYQYSD